MVVRSVGLALACAAAAGCPSGWRLQAVDGAEPSITNDTWLMISCTKRGMTDPSSSGAWRRRARPHVHCAGATTAEERALCSTSPGHRGTPTVEDPAALQSLLSFVHLSDAQLKEHQIHLEGPLGDEVTYDGIISTSNRDLLLEQNDDAALLATVLSINELRTVLPAAKPGAFAGYDAPVSPSFVIHTGDAVDSGMFSELLQFIAVMDQLDIPYFNVIGNHDNLFFGTFPGDLMSGLNVVSPYVPIVTTDRFMRYHSLSGRDQDPSLPYPAKRDDDHLATKKKGGPLPSSSYHGFDLLCTGEPPRDGALCNQARGYYTIDLQLPHAAFGTTKLQAIVLNTAQVLPESVGSAFHSLSKGNMLPEQLRWLKGQLDVKGTDKPFFLVFGHHNLKSFLSEDQGEELRAMLLAEPRVLGYVTGHTHVDDVVEWPRPTGEPLWEIIGGSTLVYPQLGRLIDVLEDPNGNRLFLRVLSFRQVLGDAAKELRLTPPSECVIPEEGDCRPLIPPNSSFCQRLADRANFARSGAARDEDEDRRDERAAVSRINGVMPVFSVKRGATP